MVGADQLDEPCAPRRGVARRDQRLDLGRAQAGRHLHHREAEVGRPDDLVLADRNAAGDLGQIFTDADANDQFLGLAERTGRRHPLGVRRQLPNRFDVGREPGQAMGGALLAI